MRDTIQGRKAPKFLQELLVRRYGANPLREPRYRLVWAPSRYERSGGVWVDWDSSLSQRERNSGARSPIRRVAEIRWVPKYPSEECWLIERWLPASAYGKREQWNAPLSQGGTLIWCGDRYVPACGEYPERGDYEDLGARMHWYPCEQQLTTAVDAFERALANRPATAFGRAMRRTQQAQEEQDRRDKQEDAFAMSLLDDASPAFGGASMVGYGEKRRPSLVEMSERIGIRQHPL